MTARDFAGNFGPIALKAEGIVTAMASWRGAQPAWPPWQLMRAREPRPAVTRREAQWTLQAAYEAFFLRSTHRRFIASESFFLPAGVRPPRRFGAAAAAAFGALAEPLVRRAAQRAFIASDRRFRPEAVSPLPRRVFGSALFRVVLLTAPCDWSRSAAMARPMRSLSVFNSSIILLRSKIVSLGESSFRALSLGERI